MNLIRYAGYDRNEDDFSNIVLPPDNRSDFGRNANRNRQQIDPAVVRIMRGAGLSYRIIAQLITDFYGRNTRYKTGTISQIIYNNKGR